MAEGIIGSIGTYGCAGQCENSSCFFWLQQNQNLSAMYFELNESNPKDKALKEGMREVQEAILGKYGKPYYPDLKVVIVTGIVRVVCNDLRPRKTTVAGRKRVMDLPHWKR